MADETFRYFWCKVTNAAARAGAAGAALDLQQRLMTRATTVAPDSPEGIELRVQQDMARWYLIDQPTKGTKVVVIAASDAARSLEVVPIPDQTIATDTWDLSTAVMPPGYTADLSRQWIDSEVGQVWANGAIICQLSHAVVVSV